MLSSSLGTGEVWQSLEWGISWAFGTKSATSRHFSYYQEISVLPLIIEKFVANRISSAMVN